MGDRVRKRTLPMGRDDGQPRGRHRSDGRSRSPPRRRSRDRSSREREARRERADDGARSRRDGGSGGGRGSDDHKPASSESRRDAAPSAAPAPPLAVAPSTEPEAAAAAAASEPVQGDGDGTQSMEQMAAAAEEAATTDLMQFYAGGDAEFSAAMFPSGSAPIPAPAPVPAAEAAADAAAATAVIAVRAAAAAAGNVLSQTQPQTATQMDVDAGYGGNAVVVPPGCHVCCKNPGNLRSCDCKPSQLACAECFERCRSGLRRAEEKLERARAKQQHEDEARVAAAVVSAAAEAAEAKRVAEEEERERVKADEAAAAATAAAQVAAEAQARAQAQAEAEAVALAIRRKKLRADAQEAQDRVKERDRLARAAETHFDCLYGQQKGDQNKRPDPPERPDLAVPHTADEVYEVLAYHQMYEYEREKLKKALDRAGRFKDFLLKRHHRHRLWLIADHNVYPLLLPWLAPSPLQPGIPDEDPMFPRVTHDDLIAARNTLSEEKDKDAYKTEQLALMDSALATFAKATCGDKLFKIYREHRGTEEKFMDIVRSHHDTANLRELARANAASRAEAMAAVSPILGARRAVAAPAPARAPAPAPTPAVAVPAPQTAVAPAVARRIPLRPAAKARKASEAVAVPAAAAEAALEKPERTRRYYCGVCNSRLVKKGDRCYTCQPAAAKPAAPVVTVPTMSEKDTWPACFYCSTCNASLSKKDERCKRCANPASIGCCRYKCPAPTTDGGFTCSKCKHRFCYNGNHQGRSPGAGGPDAFVCISCFKGEPEDTRVKCADDLFYNVIYMQRRSGISFPVPVPASAGPEWHNVIVGRQ